MPVVMPVFDTHKYITTLKAAGFTEAQAEAQSSALVGAFEVNTERLATKEDLRILATELRGEMKQLGTELRSEMADLRGEMRGEIADLRGDLRGLRSEIDQIRDMLRWMAGPSLIGTMATLAGMVVLVFKNFA